MLLVHEEDERHGKFEFATELPRAPPDLAGLGASHESMPYRRRRHEKQAFYSELIRRIHHAIAAPSGARQEERDENTVHCQ